MIRRIPVLALAALAAVALFGAACGGGGSSSSHSTSTAASAATGTPGTSATPGSAATASSAIRNLDLEHSAPVQQLIKDTGGQFVPSQVLYGDLTGDGVEEAVVPISSGGTMGDIAYVVLTPSGDGVAVLPLEKGDTVAGGVAVDIVDGKLVDTRPEYGPTDPECCPSMLHKTTYSWNGTKFVIASSQSIPNPNGGAKGTPSLVTPPAANPAPVNP